MASSADVADILELDTADQKPLTGEQLKESILQDKNKKKYKKTVESVKARCPEGMPRELFALLYADNKDAPTLIPSDTNQGYKQTKVKLGMRKARPWRWMPFTNQARKDGAVFHHWRRAEDEGKDYPFAKFNKTVDICSYSDIEYQQHLHSDSWTRQETDHLFDMCRHFNLRFFIVQDRWDRDQFPERSIVDLKERYYGVCNTLSQIRALPGHEPKIKPFDADHERRRKQQLEKLYNRTQEQEEDEEYLMTELKKIEARKKERDKKTQDLQKLISAADTSSDARRGDKTKNQLLKKKSLQQRPVGLHAASPDTTGIKFPDMKTLGVSLRSQKMKLPSSVGQKKTKAIEQLLEELGIESNPLSTEEIASEFNDLRCDIVLLYELKVALSSCEFELQTMKHRLEAIAPGKLETLKLPTTVSGLMSPSFSQHGESPGKSKKMSEIIDVVGSPSTPTNKKRKAALEQPNILRKLKKQ